MSVTDWIDGLAGLFAVAALVGLLTADGNVEWPPPAERRAHARSVAVLFLALGVIVALAHVL